MSHAAARGARKGLIALMFSLGLLAAACGGGGDDGDDGASGSANPAASAPTSAPAMSPAAVTALETRVAQAYQDERAFMPRAATDELKVTFAPETGLLTVSLRPLPTSSDNIGNSKFLGGAANDALAITSQSSLTANKVVWASFPEVKRLHVIVWTEFSLTSGSKVIEPAASTSVDRATGEKMNFDALKTSVSGDNKSFFCLADGYRFHVTIYPAISNKGCLTGISKGIVP